MALEAATPLRVPQQVDRAVDGDPLQPGAEGAGGVEVGEEL